MDGTDRKRVDIMYVVILQATFLPKRCRWCGVPQTKTRHDAELHQADSAGSGRGYSLE